MRILIVSYVDDNFGDNLIRICFEKLLRAALKDLNISDYSISRLHLRDSVSASYCDADLICFAGGGLFGSSYLGFFEHVNNITEAAEKKGIPVIFSSMGINNMDADEETERLSRELLKRKCVKSISVRENPGYFERLGAEVSLVCDPAVWASHIYGDSCPTDGIHVGINVARKGLFRENGRYWGMNELFRYLDKVQEILDERGVSYTFYTNGSFLDNNTLKRYAALKDISSEKICLIETGRDLVEAVSGFSHVLAVRMHSSIVSYSYGVPALNVVWNDKIPLFYEYIGRKDSLIPAEGWDDVIEEKIDVLLGEARYSPSEEYLMSLYRYIFEAVSSAFCDDREPGECYSFSEVKDALSGDPPDDHEDEADLRLKLKRAENKYMNLEIKYENALKEIRVMNSMKTKNRIKRFLTRKGILHDKNSR